MPFEFVVVFTSFCSFLRKKYKQMTVYRVTSFKKKIFLQEKLIMSSEILQDTLGIGILENFRALGLEL